MVYGTRTNADKIVPRRGTSEEDRPKVVLRWSGGTDVKKKVKCGTCAVAEYEELHEVLWYMLLHTEIRSICWIRC